MTDGETGLVIKENGDSVTVSITRSTACSKCGVCKIFDDGQMLVEAKNLCGAGLNDEVVVALEPGAFIEAILILYGIPFVAMLTGFFGGSAIGAAAFGESFAPKIGFFCGVIMAGIAYKIIKLIDKKRSKKGHRAVAIRIKNE